MNALAPLAGQPETSRSWTDASTSWSHGGARTRGCHITAPCPVTHANRDGYPEREEHSRAPETPQPTVRPDRAATEPDT